MNKMGMSSDAGLLSVEMATKMTESPSVTTFLPEEDASICPLLSTTPSTPLAFSHPLTPGADNDSDNASVNCEDTKAETSSSGSSGIGMDVADTAATTLFSKHAYQHLRKNAEANQENGGHKNGNLNLQITKDTPNFVSWNWPMIRKCTFFVFMSSLLAMVAIVVSMIATLPKSCNPKTAWYRGSVFYELFPASFQDSNNDGLGDLRGIASRLEYLDTLGVGAIRLNSIFPSKHYPDDFEIISSLTEIDEVLGNEQDLAQLVHSLHARNMSLLLDLPLYPYLKELDVATLNESLQENVTTTTTTTTIPSPVEITNVVTKAMRRWLALGVDGFYVKGLEHFIDDPNLVDNIAEWQLVLGADRALIINERLIHDLPEIEAKKVLRHVDLVEIHLDVGNGTAHIESQIQRALSGPMTPSEYGPWIQWSVGGIAKQRVSRGLAPNATLAATLMQLMLPGSPNIFYGDEIALEEAHDPHNEHEETKHLHHLSTMQWNGGLQFTNRDTLPWLPRGASAAFENYEDVSKMVHLRDRSPAIYKNVIVKDSQYLKNTNIKHSQDDILVVERIYPRRNTFVSVSNFGPKRVAMDMTALYYSGQVMLGRTRSNKIYFKEFEIGSMETIVVKLDK